jgi:hypothetical protein
LLEATSGFLATRAIAGGGQNRPADCLQFHLAASAYRGEVILLFPAHCNRPFVGPVYEVILALVRNVRNGSRLRENVREQRLRRIVFSSFLFRRWLPELFFSYSTQSRQTFYAQVRRLSFYTAWVKSRRRRALYPCPLLPRKQTSACAVCRLPTRRSSSPLRQNPFHSPVTNDSKVDPADQIRTDRLGCAHRSHGLSQSTDV